MCALMVQYFFTNQTEEAKSTLYYKTTQEVTKDVMHNVRKQQNYLMVLIKIMSAITAFKFLNVIRRYAFHSISTSIYDTCFDLELLYINYRHFIVFK